MKIFTQEVIENCYRQANKQIKPSNIEPRPIYRQSAYELEKCWVNNEHAKRNVFQGTIDRYSVEKLCLIYEIYMHTIRYFRLM